jgi:hypothetical protein
MSPLPKYSYMRLEPFMMPFEMLVPLMGSRTVWEYSFTGRGGREFGYDSVVEEQLELQADSLRKLLNRTRAIERVALEAKQMEPERELAILKI